MEIFLAAKEYVANKSESDFHDRDYYSGVMHLEHLGIGTIKFLFTPLLVFSWHWVAMTFIIANPGGWECWSMKPVGLLVCKTALAILPLHLFQETFIWRNVLCNFESIHEHFCQHDPHYLTPVGLATLSDCVGVFLNGIALTLVLLMPKMDASLHRMRNTVTFGTFIGLGLATTSAFSYLQSQ